MIRYRRVDERTWGHLRGGGAILAALPNAPVPFVSSGQNGAASTAAAAVAAVAAAAAPRILHAVVAGPHVALLLSHPLGTALVLLDAVPSQRRLRPDQRTSLLAGLALRPPPPTQQQGQGQGQSQPHAATANNGVSPTNGDDPRSTRSTSKRSRRRDRTIKGATKAMPHCPVLTHLIPTASAASVALVCFTASAAAGAWPARATDTGRSSSSSSSRGGGHHHHHHSHSGASNTSGAAAAKRSSGDLYNGRHDSIDDGWDAGQSMPQQQQQAQHNRLVLLLSTGELRCWEWRPRTSTWAFLGVAQLSQPTLVGAAAADSASQPCALQRAVYHAPSSTLMWLCARTGGVAACKLRFASDVVRGSAIEVGASSWILRSPVQDIRLGWAGVWMVARSRVLLWSVRSRRIHRVSDCTCSQVPPVAFVDIHNVTGELIALASDGSLWVMGPYCHATARIGSGHLAAKVNVEGCRQTNGVHAACLSKLHGGVAGPAGLAVRELCGFAAHRHVIVLLARNAGDYSGRGGGATAAGGASDGGGAASGGGSGGTAARGNALVYDLHSGVLLATERLPSGLLPRPSPLCALDGSELERDAVVPSSSTATTTTTSTGVIWSDCGSSIATGGGVGTMGGAPGVQYYDSPRHHLDLGADETAARAHPVGSAASRCGLVGTTRLWQLRLPRAQDHVRMVVSAIRARRSQSAADGAMLRAPTASLMGRQGSRPSPSPRNVDTGTPVASPTDWNSSSGGARSPSEPSPRGLPSASAAPWSDAPRVDAESVAQATGAVIASSWGPSMRDAAGLQQLEHLLALRNTRQARHTVARNERAMVEALLAHAGQPPAAGAARQDGSSSDTSAPQPAALSVNQAAKASLRRHLQNPVLSEALAVDDDDGATAAGAGAAAGAGVGAASSTGALASFLRGLQDNNSGLQPPASATHGRPHASTVSSSASASGVSVAESDGGGGLALSPFVLGSETGAVSRGDDDGLRGRSGSLGAYASLARERQRARQVFDAFTPLNVSLLPILRDVAWLDRLAELRRLHHRLGLPFRRSYELAQPQAAPHQTQDRSDPSQRRLPHERYGDPASGAHGGRAAPFGRPRARSDVVPAEFGWTRVAALGAASGRAGLGGHVTAPSVPSYRMTSTALATSGQASARRSGTANGSSAAAAGANDEAPRQGQVEAEANGDEADGPSVAQLLLDSMEECMLIQRDPDAAPGEAHLYSRATPVNPALFHPEPRAVVARQQLGAVTEGEDDSESDSESEDGRGWDAGSSGNSSGGGSGLHGGMPAAAGAAAVAAAARQRLGFTSSAQNAYFETLVRLAYSLHPERVGDLVALVDEKCPPSYKAAHTHNHGKDAVPYRSHYTRALLALPPVFKALHSTPEGGGDTPEAARVGVHAHLLTAADRQVDALRLRLLQAAQRSGREGSSLAASLAALDEAEASDPSSRAAAATRFNVTSHSTAGAPPPESFASRWALPSAQRLATFHEIFKHAVATGNQELLRTLWARRPPSYGLWSLLGALSSATSGARNSRDNNDQTATTAATTAAATTTTETTAAAAAAATEAALAALSGEQQAASWVPPALVAPPRELADCPEGTPLVCASDDEAQLPLAAVLPNLLEAADAAGSSCDELHTFWQRTGSEAERGALLRGWSSVAAS